MHVFLCSHLDKRRHVAGVKVDQIINVNDTSPRAVLQVKQKGLKT